ncbi:hypothetical protein M2444_004625 [Paenibacillus sp. PastF-3]|uniref:hypothetical protein n=1 Tax=Paenibacillus sp. PastF-3 TaxID=2940626 RepID=UPI0024740E2A|nr:hypothetical protein [Paenibacillus sp. PastF-3]MDH6372796.1 hypothetical protein [Paenibacillus sp. PastF-3]
MFVLNSIQNPLPLQIQFLFENAPPLNPTLNAKETQTKITSFLKKKGWSCKNELFINDRGDGKKGRVDIVAHKDGITLAIEIDRLHPRKKSILKLQGINAYRILILRGTVKCVIPSGIHAICSINGGNDSKEYV